MTHVEASPVAVDTDTDEDVFTADGRTMLKACAHFVLHCRHDDAPAFEDEAPTIPRSRKSLAPH